MSHMPSNKSENDLLLDPVSCPSSYGVRSHVLDVLSHKFPTLSLPVAHPPFFLFLRFFTNISAPTKLSPSHPKNTAPLYVPQPRKYPLFSVLPPQPAKKKKSPHQQTFCPPPACLPSQLENILYQQHTACNHGIRSPRIFPNRCLFLIASSNHSPTASPRAARGSKRALHLAKITCRKVSPKTGQRVYITIIETRSC